MMAPESALATTDCVARGGRVRAGAEEAIMLDLSRLHGIVPPVLTPLNDDETVDLRSLAALLEHLIDQGVHGLWINGTTGEFAGLSGEQRAAAIRVAVEVARGRVPIVANIGDASTRLAIGHGRAAIDLPLLVYNIPQTVKVKLDVGTMVTLANEGTVVGLKDSQNDLDWFRSVVVGARERVPTLKGFLGTRALIDAAVLIGGVGSIPGISNLYPRWCVLCHEAAARGDWAEAARWQEMVMTGTSVTSVGTGSGTAQTVGGMKAVLQAEGIIASRRMSQPLRTLTDAEAERVVAAYRTLTATPTLTP
jgi:4-hydroxy-tetrahydrodipicolinate synthase